jgi:hypothetical protein
MRNLRSVLVTPVLCFAFACASDDMQSMQPLGSAGTGAGTFGSAGTFGAAGSGDPLAGSGAAGQAGSQGAGMGGMGGMAGAQAGEGGSGVPSEDAGVPMPMFEDPGSDPWMLVPSTEVASTCGLDADLLQAANSEIGTPYAVIRYGKLCHQSGADNPSEAFSATKTLGALVTGIAAYETRDLVKSGPMTGPISDADRADHWLSAATISFNDDAQLAHVLAMVGHNADLSYEQKTYAYDTIGTTQINRLSDVINTAIAQDATRLGATSRRSRRSICTTRSA